MFFSKYNKNQVKKDKVGGSHATRMEEKGNAYEIFVGKPNERDH
jgi:hypothetical protein